MTNRPTQSPDRLLTLADVADFLAVSLSTVRRLVRDGNLPAVRVGQRSIRVRPEDLEAYLQASVEKQGNASKER